MNKVIKWLLLIAWLLTFFSIRGSLRNTLGFNQPNISPPVNVTLPGTDRTKIPDGESSALSSQEANSDSLFIWEDK